MDLPYTENLFDLSDVNNVSDEEVRIILGKLLERLNLMPTRTTYLRKGIEMQSYDFRLLND
ncbi:MAG: hypothetical protein JHC33_09685 [Ignisphaera sp.]|nr:hypothetical protein [Ignisphaera sp.]